jgi:hypothetical protein
MHSASSAACLWLAVVADLTAVQYCQVLRTDYTYAVSFARTVAGVHYTTDNIAELSLGRKIVADQLAGDTELMLRLFSIRSTRSSLIGMTLILRPAKPATTIEVAQSSVYVAD